MIRGTTPTFTITINGAKVSSLGVIYVTLKQGTVQYDLTPTVVDDSTISVTLTQAQTLSFVAGTYAYIQVRAANTSGVAVATWKFRYKCNYCWRRIYNKSRYWYYSNTKYEYR